MKIFVAIVIGLTASLAAMAGGTDVVPQGDPLGDAEDPVSPNFFREHYLTSYASPDLRVELRGGWNDPEVKRLGKLLRAVRENQPKRPATIPEWSQVSKLVFWASDRFDSNVRVKSIPNPARIWGSGISEFLDHEYWIPIASSTDDDIKNFLDFHLPDQVIKDPKAREDHQAKIASLLRGRPSFCSWLLARNSRR